MNKTSQVETSEKKAPAAPAGTPAAASATSQQPVTSPASARHADWWRETIESIVVALILAFLFRTFEAEAFVIPTGSMAPTLLGRHKDVNCELCGYRFTVGASEEVDNFGYLIANNASRIESALCPNCHYPIPHDQVLNAPAFTGDRILVNKFPYEFSDPRRWDVLVFKYPEEPKTNYIKRLIGLPGETIEIRQGDIYLQKPTGPQICWKSDAVKQREVQILVYDNDRPEKQLHDKGWPERWAPVKKNATGTAGWGDDVEGWQSQTDQRSFSIGQDQSANELRWIRYRNFVPSETDWHDLKTDQSLRTPQPQLIIDFCGYNAASSDSSIGGDSVGMYWVGDLMLDCQVDLEKTSPGAQLLFELNEGARKYRCRINPETGKATLYYPDPLSRDEEAAAEVVLAEADTRLKGVGSYHVTFANEDNHLTLWIDGRSVDFGDKTGYEPHGGLPFQPPTDNDLIPVGIAVKGVEAKVSHLVLHRDIYYRCDFWHPGNRQMRDDFGGMDIKEYEGHWSDLARNNSRPKQWFEEYERGLAINKTGAGKVYEGVPFTFPLGEDEFFVMGDNSPRSKDSRLWSNARNADHRHAVPRSSLVGKAFFVYWPHGVPFLNDGRGYPDGESGIFQTAPLDRFFYHQYPPTRENPRGQIAEPPYPSRRVPFYPNIQRMERIR